MSQHDMNIANQGFPAFRADLNDALAALASTSTGATEPSTTFAQQLWYDSTANLLKMRNTDNDAWITLAYFDQTNDEWEIRSAAIQAVDSAGISFKTDDGTTRFVVQDDGDINFDSGTLFVDAANNRVGIGNSSPDSTFHISDASAPKLTIEDTTNPMTGFIIGENVNMHIGTETNHGVRFSTNNTERMIIDTSGNVGIGTSSPTAALDVRRVDADGLIAEFHQSSGYGFKLSSSISVASIESGYLQDFVFKTGSTATERMRITSGGQLLVGKTSVGGGSSIDGVEITRTGSEFATNDGRTVVIFNRNDNDGTIISLRQADTQEGTISVSGTTVSYNGGHLARWSRLADDSKDTSIVKGTVMTNLDEMVEWSHDAVEAVEAQDAVYDDDGNVVTEAVKAVEARDAYTEDNEQLNKMAVSSIEGDPNVAGVFVNWDNDDDFNDMNIAMTGDMVIRIAQGTTVERGDLLMSAGDGTAKPQGDDIVRSKTIAKVTSTHVSHTYDDGSYLVPCVLMAC